MEKSGAIVAIGGGGFTHQCDPILDDFCLNLLPPLPSIGFVGMASGDAPEKIERFYDRFRGHSETLSHLPHGASFAETSDWLAGKDMVYFGGGNSEALVRQLRERNLASLFQRANKRGLVLAGVSAGGICWFDWALSDAGGNGYAVLKGLGLVASGACPHYREEPERRPAFETLITRDASLSGYAIDDGACVVAYAGQVKGYFSVREGSAAYLVSKSDTFGVRSKTLPQLT